MSVFNRLIKRRRLFTFTFLFSLYIFLTCNHFCMLIALVKVDSFLTTALEHQNSTLNVCNSCKLKYGMEQSKVTSILHSNKNHTQNLQTHTIQDSYSTLHTHISHSLRITFNIFTFSTHPRYTNLHFQNCTPRLLFGPLDVLLCVIKKQNVYFKLLPTGPLILLFYTVPSLSLLSFSINKIR